MLDAELMQQVIGAIGGRRVAGSRPESDVVSDGQVGKQRGVLEDQADAPPFGRLAGDVGSGQAEGDPMYGGGRVNLATGEVWAAPERQRGRARAWLADAGYYVRKGLPPS